MCSLLTIFAVQLQVEQRSELVDVVTKLAKEEAAAERAAAARADAASGTTADKPDVGPTEAVSKRNAAAALKQVRLTSCKSNLP